MTRLPALLARWDAPGGLPLDLKVSARARRMTLRVDGPTRTVRLVVPRRTPAPEIDAFLQRSRGWLERRIAELPERVPFAAGVAVPIHGIPRQIRPTGQLRGLVTLTADALEVPGPPEGLERRVRRHLLELAAETLQPLAEAKAARLQRPIARIDLRDPRSRWGSCSSEGRLMFSWRLVLAPPVVQDYVVGHEVAHLQHLDHSRAFWRLAALLSEDLTTGRAWLRRHGGGLHRWG